MTALFSAANRNPRMRDVYLEYFGLWVASGGDTMNQYNDVGAWSKWGLWGALEHVTQDPATAPKYRGCSTSSPRTRPLAKRGRRRPRRPRVSTQSNVRFRKEVETPRNEGPVWPTPVSAGSSFRRYKRTDIRDRSAGGRDVVSVCCRQEGTWHRCAGSSWVSAQRGWC